MQMYRIYKTRYFYNFLSSDRPSLSLETHEDGKLPRPGTVYFSLDSILSQPATLTTDYHSNVHISPGKTVGVYFTIVVILA